MQTEPRALPREGVRHEDHHHPEYFPDRWEHDFARHELRPPGALNVALALLIMSGGWAMHWYAARQDSWLVILGVGVVFGLWYLPLYTLMHEAMHRIFHPNRRVNDLFGLVMMAMMPGPFTFFRFGHNAHHRLNRSDAELFDAYYPEDSALKKRLAFYFYYLGGFWFIVFLTNFVFLLVPWFLESQAVKQSKAAGPKVIGNPQKHKQRIRLEALFNIALHVVLFWALELRLETYAALYACFAFSWSSQNFITHAHSPRHVLNGAYNLSANRLWSLWLLNFNYHLAHHQHPSVPWIHLPRINDERRERPNYLWTWITFWAGPRPATDPPPVPLSAYRAARPEREQRELDEDMLGEIEW